MDPTAPVLDALAADEPDGPAILDALPAEPPPLPPPLPAPRRRGILGWVGSLFRGLFSLAHWLFGFAALLVGLAVLAALPILQLLSLGYLLEAGGRVARTGRLRDGFIGVRQAAHLGGILLGCWLFLLPMRFVASMAYSAQILDPGGPVARAWRLGMLLLIVLTGLHIAAACARGRLRYFFWPFNLFWLIRQVWRGGWFSRARDAVWDSFVSLRLDHYFYLGWNGFVAAAVWLVIPVSLLALGAKAPLVGFLGAFLLGIVLLYLPFLQLRAAEHNRLGAAFELRAVRAEYRAAPWAFAFAFVVTLVTAVPLYLLKIEMIPREAAWLPSLVFIAFIFPARLITGWALSRARRRQVQPRHWFFRWTGRLPILPVAAIYVLIVYFTQFTSWNGIWNLYEQHAFLVPVPFFSM